MRQSIVMSQVRRNIYNIDADIFFLPNNEKKVDHASSKECESRKGKHKRTKKRTKKKGELQLLSLRIWGLCTYEVGVSLWLVCPPSSFHCVSAMSKAP